jgi:uncharacterized membrane protein YdjX (TVP38/TMEM64 family)
VKRSKRRTLTVVVLSVVVVGIALLFRDMLHLHLFSTNRLIEFVNAARAHRLASIGFYFLFVIGVMALPITLFPIIGGVLFPFGLALPLNVAAATLGAFLSFCVTRYFGSRYIEPILRKRIKTWDKIADARGFQTVLLLRLVGIPPFIVSNYALGLSRVNVPDFLLATAIGILPWMGIVTFLANSLWQAVLVGGEAGLRTALWHALSPLFFVSCVIACVMLALHGIRRRARHSNL